MANGWGRMGANMTRPERNKNRPRPIKKETFFSEAEWAKAELAAQATGLPFQEFMRKTVLAQKVKAKRHQQAQNLVFELSKVMMELNRVGNNVNQIAKSAHVSGYAQDAWGLEADLAELRCVVAEIAETIKKV